MTSVKPNNVRIFGKGSFSNVIPRIIEKMTSNDWIAFTAANFFKFL